MRLIRKLKTRVARMLEAPLPPATPRERELIQELRQKFSKLDGSDAPTDREWQENTARLAHLVENEDPREFIRWDVIRHTMFVGNATYVREELDWLKRRPDWSTRWEAALREDGAGRPTPSDCHPESSGNLIHHAYHVARFEADGQVPVDQLKFAFEFGGGYGGMCRLVRRLGFEGTYVIFDLPHFSTLQEYYLASLGANVITPDEAVNGIPGVCCISDVETARDLITQLAGSDAAASLFLATWSFSESPVALREMFSSVLPLFGNISLAYQNNFGGVDNCDWFQNFQSGFESLSWNGSHMDHLPGNYYLTGGLSRKAA